MVLTGEEDESSLWGSKCSRGDINLWGSKHACPLLCREMWLSLLKCPPHKHPSQDSPQQAFGALFKGHADQETHGEFSPNASVHGYHSQEEREGREEMGSLKC